MKPKQQAYPFFQLSRDIFRLLSLKQRVHALKNIGSSLIQAVLEVVSLTAIIPLFFAFLHSDESSFINTKVPYAFSWQTVLIAIVLIFLVKNIIALTLNHYQFQFIHNVFISMSKQLYHNFYKQSWTDYLQQNSTDTVRKIKHTPSDFANYVLQGYLSLITDTFICILMALVLLWYNVQIVLIIGLLCTPIILFYYWFRINILSEVNRSFRELTPRANVIITQGIDAFAEAKIYAKEKFFIEHFMIFNHMTSRYLANLKSAANIPSRLFEIVGILSFAAVVAYSKLYPGYQENLLVLLGLLSVAMYRLIPSLNRILTSLSQIQAYAYSVSELKESFYALRTGVTSSQETIYFKKRITFENVSFQYPGDESARVLENVSLTINKGDFVVLEGPSGSGKTTFIHILTGLISNYQGRILIDEQELTQNTLPLWQQNLAFVPQAPIVLQETILHNVAFGEESNAINVSEVETALRYAGLYDFVLRMPHGLQSPVGENGLTLSGGQRQRLALARALYRKPQILILDEVTNQLDYDNKLKILATLKELSASGITIILASHDVLVTNFATRVLKLNNKALRDTDVLTGSSGVVP